MVKDIKVRTSSDDKFILTEDYQYGIITIPKGYKTNGADVPLFATLLIPRYLPSNLPMVAMHDYLTDNERYKLADTLFEEMFINSKQGYTFRRKIAVKAVRLYHRLRYGVK